MDALSVTRKYIKDRKLAEATARSIEDQRTLSFPSMLRRYVEDPDKRHEVGSIVIRAQMAEQSRQNYQIKYGNDNDKLAQALESSLTEQERLILVSRGIESEGNRAVEVVPTTSWEEFRRQYLGEGFVVGILKDSEGQIQEQCKYKGVRLLIKKRNHANTSGYISNFPTDRLPPPRYVPIAEDTSRLLNLANKHISDMILSASTIIMRETKYDRTIDFMDAEGKGIKLEQIDGKWLLRGFVDSISYHAPKKEK